MVAFGYPRPELLFTRGRSVQLPLGIPLPGIVLLSPCPSGFAGWRHMIAFSGVGSQCEERVLGGSTGYERRDRHVLRPVLLTLGDNAELACRGLISCLAFRTTTAASRQITEEFPEFMPPAGR